MVTYNVGSQIKRDLQKVLFRLIGDLFALFLQCLTTFQPPQSITRVSGALVVKRAYVISLCELWLESEHICSYQVQFVLYQYHSITFVVSRVTWQYLYSVTCIVWRVTTGLLESCIEHLYSVDDHSAAHVWTKPWWPAHVGHCTWVIAFTHNYQLEELSSIEDRGQTDCVTTASTILDF